LRILFLNHNVVRKGGTFYRAFHVARFLVRAGHSVTLLTISPAERLAFTHENCDGVEVVHTPDLLSGVGRTGWDPFDTVRRIGYLHGKQWDIIHAWDCRPVVILPALYARWQSRAVGGKLAMDWCDWWGRGGTQRERPGTFAKMIYGPVETFFEEAFRTLADGTTVASRALRERAVALGVADATIMALPGGCDTDTVRPGSLTEARAQLGIDPKARVVGYLGVIPAKEMALLTDAFRLVREEMPGLRFLAIGVSVAGSPQTLRKAVGAHWGDWIIDTGRIPFDRVGLHLAACDAVVLPMLRNVSNTARWPSKINDYLAAGRPIVATRVGEVVPLLAKQVGVAADDDARSIAEALAHVLRHRPEAESCGQRGRELAEGELNWTQITRRLEHFYERLHDAPKAIGGITSA
jgi:glycosyltransferase involved in cell wall biosynthesis